MRNMHGMSAVDIRSASALIRGLRAFIDPLRDAML